MFNPFRFFTRPEYLFRPSQVLQRFRRLLSGPPQTDFVTLKMPWGTPLRVRPNEVIGVNIWSYGIFDLIVAEAIARLLDPSETAVDIGANIGQMTSLMRHIAGPHGHVYAFEPQEAVFSELQYNMNVVNPSGAEAPVTLHQIGLSDTDGVAHLDTGEHWATNRGMSRIVTGDAAQTSGTSQIKVKRLDSVLPSQTKIGVCKIDVEGHELSVLKGASQTLAETRLRDVIFEDLDPYPTLLHQHFRRAGFSLFSLHVSPLRPWIEECAEQSPGGRSAEAGNYLATLEPERAISRFRRGGWFALKHR